jgi:hypothetical protein
MSKRQVAWAMPVLLGALAGCATQMDIAAPDLGKALNAAKDAQRLSPAVRDDGLAPRATELPGGVMPPPAQSQASGSAWGGSTGGTLLMPAAR